MSDKKIIGTPFTPANAPRNGRASGSRNKVNRYAWKVIEDLLADYKEHGKATIDILRIERPYEYIKASLAATEIAQVHGARPAGRRTRQHFHQSLFPRQGTSRND